MPRRVPVPSLRPPLDLMKSTGVALGAGSRVVVAPDEGGVAEELDRRGSRSRGVTVLVARGRPGRGRSKPGSEMARRRAGPRRLLAPGPRRRAVAPRPSISPPSARRTAAASKSLHAAMRVLYDAVASPGTFLVSATRMGGLHG